MEWTLFELVDVKFNNTHIIFHVKNKKSTKLDKMQAAKLVNNIKV